MCVQSCIEYVSVFDTAVEGAPTGGHNKKSTIMQHPSTTTSAPAISRRTITAGLAWTVPVITATAAAPALAASNRIRVTCPTASSVMTLQGGSAMSVSSVLAGDGTYPGGTYFTISAGQWNVSSAQTTTGATVTGFYLVWGTSTTGTCSPTCDTYPGNTPKGSLKVTNRSGTKYDANLTLATPTACSPQVAGAGLAVNLGIQTAIPYSALICSDSQLLGCVSIPFTVIYLDGLGVAASNACCYWYNACFEGGCQPNYETSWSITSSPLYT